MLPTIETGRLIPHPNNPRQDLGDLTELSESIKIHGVLQNLTVIPADIEAYRRETKSKKGYTGDYTTPAHARLRGQLQGRG